MSTLRLFRKEYEEHVVDKKCAAKNCTALRRFVIRPEPVSYTHLLEQPAQWN